MVIDYRILTEYVLIEVTVRMRRPTQTLAILAATVLIGTIFTVSCPALVDGSWTLSIAGERVQSGYATAWSAAGQGQPVGVLTGGLFLAQSGFFHTVVLQPHADADGDGVPDEVETDDDGDGLSDEAELRGTGFQPATPTDLLKADTDGDGSSDAEEAVAGTNPQDAASLLAVGALVQEGAALQLRWAGRANFRYEVLYGATVEQLVHSPQVAGPFTSAEGAGPWQTNTLSADEVPIPDRGFYSLRVIH